MNTCPFVCSHAVTIGLEYPFPILSLLFICMLTYCSALWEFQECPGSAWWAKCPALSVLALPVCQCTQAHARRHPKHAFHHYKLFPHPFYAHSSIHKLPDAQMFYLFLHSNVSSELTLFPYFSVLVYLYVCVTLNLVCLYIFLSHSVSPIHTLSLSCIGLFFFWVSAQIFMQKTKRRENDKLSMLKYAGSQFCVNVLRAGWAEA